MPVAKTMERGITAQQILELRDLLFEALQRGPETLDTKAPEGSPSRGKALSWTTLNMHQVDAYFTKPITAPFKCSWVEFITGGDKQLPHWFVSHAWDTCFAHTAKMLTFHAKSRSMDQWQKLAYWCCAFANNQHDLHELQEQDIMETPFAKAMHSVECQGTLLLCNPDVTPLQRVWCIFELHLTHQLQRTSGKAHSYKPWHFMDVAVPVLDEQIGTSGVCNFKVALLQDGGLGNFLEVNEAPDTYFPLEVAHVGTKVDIAKAEATLVEDRNSILNYVSRKASIRDRQPPVTHPAYDKLNGYIHGIFASAELYRLCCQRPSDLAAVERLLELRADPTRFVRAGNTAFHAAMGADPLDTGDVSNSLQVLQLLLTARGDPNVLNSQLCTPLDYATERPDGEAFANVLRSHGAKPFEEVAEGVESSMKLHLKQILSQGCHDEAVAFNARWASTAEVKLQWQARLPLRAAAINLSFYPTATCHITVSPNIRPHMSGMQVNRQEQQAKQRAEAVLSFLVAAGCKHSFEIHVQRQSELLSLGLELPRPKAVEGIASDASTCASSVPVSAASSELVVERVCAAVQATPVHLQGLQQAQSPDAVQSSSFALPSSPSLRLGGRRMLPPISSLLRRGLTRPPGPTGIVPQQRACSPAPRPASRSRRHSSGLMSLVEQEPPEGVVELS